MKKSSWSIVGGLVTALGASLCCAGPLVLISLGISGAWIANLAALEPYRPYFITVVVLFFVWSGWQLFRPSIDGKTHCSPDDVCATPKVQRNRKLLYVASALIALGLIASPYWIVFLF